MLTIASTQTELSFELLLNFLENDLPRLISYDVVPLLFKVINNMNDGNSVDCNKTLQQQIEVAIKKIVDHNLPKSQPSVQRKSSKLIVDFRKYPMKQVERGALNIVECQVCKITFETYPELIKHLQTHTTSTASQLDCKFCTFETNEPLVLAKHIQTDHVRPFNNRTTWIHCAICSEKFACQAALSRHRSMVHRNVTCRKCNMTFEYISQLHTHLKFSLTCSTNTSTPATVPLAENDTANIIGDALLKVLDGNVPEIKVQASLPDTADQSTDEGPTAYILEDVTTDNNTRYKFARNYKCNECCRRFTSLSVLNHHRNKVHTEKKSLSCTRCARLFVSFTELESHFHRVHNLCEWTTPVQLNKKSKTTLDSATLDSATLDSATLETPPVTTAYVIESHEEFIKNEIIDDQTVGNLQGKEAKTTSRGRKTKAPANYNARI